MASLLRSLRADKKDEDKAIKIYGRRQKQFPHLKGMYKEMQDDEKDHSKKLGAKMPVSEYFKGSGSKVMKSMQSRYGDKKGKSVFYATANKRKMAPSDKTKKKMGVH